ncbi:uncharacterized protein V6R79_010116 [Siganus canaliculatus]
MQRLMCSSNQKPDRKSDREERTGRGRSLLQLPPAAAGRGQRSQRGHTGLCGSGPPPPSRKLLLMLSSRSDPGPWTLEPGSRTSDPGPQTSDLGPRTLVKVKCCS